MPDPVLRPPHPATDDDTSPSAPASSSEWPSRPRLSVVGRVRDRESRLGEALALAYAGREWTVAEYAEELGVSRSTAWRDLSELAAAGSLVRVGDRRERRYVLPAG